MAEKEYIERDMYYQKINGLSKGGCGDYPLYCLAINDCMNVLDEMPAADVAPVRHGAWANEETAVTCTACGRSYDTDFEIKRNVILSFDYCPNCGAKMDGGDLNGS